jgi:arsenite methyltransferase
LTEYIDFYLFDRPIIQPGGKMTRNPTPIHESVREFYAAQARSSSSCCGPESGSCCGPSQTNGLYPVELITNIPEDVTNFSLGCGDPISLAGLKPGETILDLGSGGGLDCFLAARQVGEAGSVIGVDMTPEMLARARASAVQMGVRNVEFREGYLERLPVEDGSVDVVISNCVINLSPDKPQVFREVFRVLRPGGRVAVSDIVTNGALPDSIHKNMQAWGACVAGALDMKNYTRGMEEAGFIRIQVQPKDGSGNPIPNLPVGQPFSATITAQKPA